MNELGRDRDDKLWASSALALASAVLLLLALEILRWHPGYALGDEGDIIAFLQRVREGMPFRWVVANGSIHKTLTLASLSLWPGQLWATSVPGYLALVFECLLLFILGRRYGGSRAGFFALAAGLLSAFTLIRARVALSYCLFPVEWLLLLWLRPKAKEPWAALLWGGLLGLCCFDYEAWLPMAALLLVLPLQRDLSRSQRAWEIVGFVAVLAWLLPWEQFVANLDRRRNASFLAGKDTVSMPQKLWQLIWNAPCQPYMAPAGHGVLPLVSLLALPWGLRVWGSDPWRPGIYLLTAIAVALAGGAAYGLPAHRVIMAWPLLALLTGLAIDHGWQTLDARWKRTMLLVFVAFLGAYQLVVWWRAGSAMDIPSRSPIRDLQRAAQAAWERSHGSGLPLVTELHPLKGAQFRYLSGKALELPDAGAKSVVAYLPWDYLPALEGKSVEVASFKEAGGSAPEFIGILNGSAARDALETEREQRPLLLKARLFSLESGGLEAAWLREHPKASPWARTFGLDYEGFVLQANYRVSVPWIDALQQETLVSVRPLLVGILTLKGKDPAAALLLATRARKLDPLDARARRLERELLLRTGNQEQALRLDKEVQTLYEQGRLLSEQ